MAARQPVTELVTPGFLAGAHFAGDRPSLASQVDNGCAGI